MGVMGDEDESRIIVFKQRCCSFGSLFVGMTGNNGGMALAHYTKVHTTKPLYDITGLPYVKPFLKKIPNSNLLIGAKNMWVRLALQGAGCAMAYSYLECAFQKGHKRTIFDAALAGAITGGAFGLRGIPGGNMGAAYGAGGLAAYALIMQLIFR